MTITEFTKLPFLEKALFMYGPKPTFLEKYEEKGYLVQIYSYNNFFIEVEINLTTADYQITPFKRGFNKKDPASPIQNEVLTYYKAA